MSVVRWTLFFFLVLLPVQALLQPAPAPISWIDEILLVLLLPLAAVRRLKGGGFHGERAVLAALGLVVGVGAVSAIANRVPPLVAALGTFDYLKLVLYFWLFATLCGDRRWFDRTYRVLVVVAVLACICALGQEAVRLVTGRGPRRLGIFRVRGFLGHPNNLGLYSLLFLLIEGARLERPRGRLALLYSGVVMSVSRFVHAAAFVLTLPLLRRRPWLAFVCAASLAFTVAMIPDTAREHGDGVPRESGPAALSYRAYTLERAREVWNDHRALGAGPGRFGGVVSLKFESPLYERYPWDPNHFKFFKRIRSLDQFPPQLLAELGVAGGVAFALMYLVLLRAAWLARAADRGLGTGIFLALLVGPFYALGSGLNLPAYPITLMGLAGAWTGSAASSDEG